MKYYFLFIIIVLSGCSINTGNIKQSNVIPENRTPNSIEQTFQSNKSSFFQIYNKFLQVEPELEGKVVISLTILGTGSVEKVKTESVKIKSKVLLNEIKILVSSLDFGKVSNNKSMVAKYPINFLPN